MSEILEEMMEYEDTQKGKYLTFKLGKEVFGLEIRYVTEIIGVQPIFEVPQVPKYVKGIINLRGKIIPVIDVRLKFKKPAVEYDDRTCIVVIDILESSIGLIVDNVSEVLSISDDNIVDPPEYKSSFHNRYIKSIGRVGEDVKLILDCEKLLGTEELEHMEENEITME
jgi:purine-binding chemotaxis protein CheW